MRLGEVLDVASQIASGDLKPDNIFITIDGRVKILACAMKELNFLREVSERLDSAGLR